MYTGAFSEENRNNGRVSLTLLGAAIAAGIFCLTKKKCEKARKEGRHIPYGPYEAIFKRPLDILFSSMALFTLSPVLGITALIVRFGLGTPVLFAQQRPGKDERLFTMYKFRTMTDERNADGNLLPDDMRLSGLGRLLRSTSLDELPELFNIVKGDMSIIGPRPLLVEYLPHYTQNERHRHDVRPGLSGMAQVHGRNTISWEDKFGWDLKYVNKITFLGDMKILAETVYKTLRRDDIRVGRQHVVGRLDIERQRINGEAGNEKNTGKEIIFGNQIGLF